MLQVKPVLHPAVRAIPAVVQNLKVVGWASPTFHPRHDDIFVFMSVLFGGQCSPEEIVLFDKNKHHNIIDITRRNVK